MQRVLIITCMLAAYGLQARSVKMNIEEAIRSKGVEVMVSSLGGYQGYCLNLMVRNLSADSLVVFVEAGRKFIAGNAPEQDILVVKQEVIVLRRNQERSVKLKGYCCQAHDRAPSVNAKYSVGQLADSALYALARHFNAREFEPGVEQQAIWAISDNRPTSSIPFGEDSCARDLRKFVAVLKHEPIPWYTLGMVNTVYGNGVIDQQPSYVAGCLKFSNSETRYGTFSVADSSGAIIAYMKCEWLRSGIDNDYHFKVPVAGLRKGRYYVQIRAGETTLAKREFDI